MGPRCFCSPRSTSRASGWWDIGATCISYSQGIQKFSLNLLHKVILYREEKMQHVNEMMSPFSVWTMLLMLYHGAKGKTFEQLRDVMGITVEEAELKKFYEDTRELRE